MSLVEEVINLGRVDAVEYEYQRLGDFLQRTVIERAQISIGRCRNDQRVAVVLTVEKLSVPTLTVELALGGRKYFSQSLRLIVSDGIAVEFFDGSFVLELKDEIIGDEEKGVMPASPELVNYDPVEIDLVPAGRHYVLEYRYPHVITSARSCPS